MWSCAPLVVVSTGGICAGFRTCRTCHRSALVLWWCAPCLLSALLHCTCRVACKYGSISRFKGVFKGVLWCGCVFVWVWGFAWIVWLLCACGVRRLYDLRRVCLYFIAFAYVLSLTPMFYLFCIRFSSSSPFFCPLSCPFAPAFFACPLVLSLCRLLFFFPLRMYAQKERAQSVVLCVLSRCFVQSFKFL